jgi:hypothetical protein
MLKEMLSPSTDREESNMQCAELVGYSGAVARQFVLAVLVCAGSVGVVFGQDDVNEAGDEHERDLDSEHCVRISEIDKIDIVDSDTLIFRLRRGKVYRNELPHRCPGLRPDDTLMYRSSVGRLCSIDVVTVLEDWGFGYAPGASCGLGMFEPITAQIADEMLRTRE